MHPRNALSSFTIDSLIGQSGSRPMIGAAAASRQNNSQSESRPSSTEPISDHIAAFNPAFLRLDSMTEMMTSVHRPVHRSLGWSVTSIKRPRVLVSSHLYILVCRSVGLSVGPSRFRQKQEKSIFFIIQSFHHHEDASLAL